MGQPRIFISYRRGDSAPYAGRLNDHLNAALGNERVFMDVEDIAPGQNFTTVLRQSIDAAAVVLVLIGPNWLSAAREDGTRRLDDTNDYVRFEIAEALRLNKRVIPILLNATVMPQSGDLPTDLQVLALSQALQLSDANFDRDVAVLIQAIGGANSGLNARQKWLAGGVLFGVLLLMIVAGGFWVGQKMTNLSPNLSPVASSSDPAGQPVMNADITGTWHAPVVYEWDNSKYTERFQFKPIAGMLTGTASFLTVPRGIQALELKGKAISFETHTKGSMGDKEINYVLFYRGQVDGDTMRLAMQTTGGYDAAVPREIVAQRVSRE